MNRHSVLLCTALLGIGVVDARERDVSRMPDGVIVRLDSTDLRIRVCDDRTIRVQVYPSGAAPTRESIVVIKQWTTPAWGLQQDSSGCTLTADGIGAKIDFRSGSIAFTGRDGTPLVREAALRPHELVPATVAGERVVQVTQRFQLAPAEGIYGLGQFEGGMMNYRNHRITLIQNNRHVCVPVLVSSRNYGIYWDNYSHTEFKDDADGMSFSSEVADGIDYYLFAGETMDDVIGALREATGRVPMFPRWAFGYWQSKERYENQDQLMSVAREYRRRGIPVDNIVQDWQYWGKLGWNAMAFDSAAYPDPRGMIDSLHRLYNLHLMISIWPQVDSTTAVYRELKQTGHLYPTPVWNGGKTYDAYSREAREIYWKHLERGLYALGVDAWWVDATEPDWKWCDSLSEEKEGILLNGMTALGTSARYLNTYALMATGGIYENQRKANPDRRVVMLTRSAFVGQQRNSAAVWSGDISSTWSVFRAQIAAGINFSMAGIPFWNSDIGGFLPKEYGGEYPLGTRDSAYCELYVRWFQFGAFCPIFRAHGTDFPREIWRFGEPGSWAYDALVKYDRLRYRLLPYIYSAAWTVSDANATLMRGLPMDFPHDPRVLSMGSEFMFGPSILVAPVTRMMYYPKNPVEIIPSRNLLTPKGLPGLEGSYFKGKNFDSLVLVRRDSVVRFTWTGIGAPGVGKKDFTVRWDGRLRTREAGLYQFEVTSDDGVNLWVNGQQIMDEMYPAGRQMNIGEIALKADTAYAIRLEYQQVDGGAEVALAWRTPSMQAAYRPRTETGSWEVYLPNGARWYDFWTGQRHPGGIDILKRVPIDCMPLYIRAGSILPLGPHLQYATERPADTLEIRVYRGADGEFELYEDENDGYGYEKGARSTIPFTWNEKKRTLSIGERRGAFPGMLEHRTFNVVLVEPDHGAGDRVTENPDRMVEYSGRTVNLTFPRAR